MRKVHVGLIMAVLLSACVLALGEPSLMGYTGLLLAPTADTLGDRQYNVAIASTEAHDWDDRAYLANFGLQPGLEAGVQWWHPEYGGSETLLNLKYRFQPPTPGRASLAVGVSDVTDELNTAVYFVASQELGQSVGQLDGKPVSLLRVHGGISGGWIDDFFFGAELRLGERLTVMAEHINDDVNLGVRMHPWRNFTVDAGLLDMDEWAANISYNYPLPVGQAQVSEAIVTVQPASPIAQQLEVAAPPKATDTSVKEQKPAATELAPSTQQTAAAPVSVEVTVKLPSAETKQTGKAPGVSADKPVEDIPLGGRYPDSAIMRSGHLFVPLRPVAKWLGFFTQATLTANGMKITVEAKTTKSAQLHIGSTTVTCDGQTAELSSVPYLLGGETTMVPVDFFEKALAVSTHIDTAGGVILFERDDAVGRISFGK